MLAACFALALVRALRVRNATWLEVVCFFACMLLGNAYWLGYLLVFGETPHYSYVAELSWIAGYIFLLMLLVECDQRRGVCAPVYAAWIPVAACAACCVYYVVESGNLLLNIADNGLVAALGFFAVRGLAARPAKRDDGGLAANKPFYAAVLAFVAVEQLLWMSSLLLDPGPIAAVSPYIVVGFLLTLSYAVILACSWRSGGL